MGGKWALRGSRLRRERSPLSQRSGRIGFSRVTRIRLLTSASLGVTFAVLLGAAAHWRLLWGADFPGIYTSQDFLYRPGVDVALPSLIAAFDGSNAYATQYLFLGIEAAVASFCIQLLTGAVVRGTYSGPAALAAESIAGALYLTNPYILTFGTTSLLSNVLISNSAFIAFLAILVRILVDVRNGLPVARSRAVFLGVAIGLSDPPFFPNLLRIQAVIAATLTLGLLYLLITTFRKGASTGDQRRTLRVSILRFFVFSLPAAAVLVAYPLWSAVKTLLLPNGTLGGIISSQPSLQVTTYNGFPLVIRLLGKVTFHNFAYSGLYSGTSIESIASWAWPLLALGVPLLAVLVGRPRFLGWKLVAVAEALGWAAVAWSDGPNSPFGFVVGPLVQTYPGAIYAFPYYYAEYQVLSVLYPVLAAISIVWLGLGTRDLLMRPQDSTSVRSNRSVEAASAPPTRAIHHWERPSLPSIGSKAVVLGLTALLLFVALPVYDGQTLSSKGSLKPGGFEVPDEYSGLQSALHSLSGTTLLLPGVKPLLETSWGYYGQSSFYTVFNFPSEVLQPDSYGQFGSLTPANSRIYHNLTEPLVPGGTPVFSNGSYRLPIRQGGADGPLTIVWSTNQTQLDFSRWDWAGFTFQASNPSLLENEIGNGNVSIGIESVGPSGRHTTWFPMLDTFDSEVTNRSGGEVRSVVLLDFPPEGAIDPKNVTAVEVRVVGLNQGSPLILSLAGAGVEGWRGSGIAPSWASAVKSSGVTSILTDATLVGGLLAPQGYARLCLSALQKAGQAILFWNSTDLEVYQVAVT